MGYFEQKDLTCKMYKFTISKFTLYTLVIESCEDNTTYSLKFMFILYGLTCKDKRIVYYMFIYVILSWTSQSSDWHGSMHHHESL